MATVDLQGVLPQTKKKLHLARAENHELVMLLRNIIYPELKQRKREIGKVPHTICFEITLSFRCNEADLYKFIYSW